MRRSLPPRAHLAHLKKQAKDLLTATRAGEPEAADRLRGHLKRLAAQKDVAAASVSLQEAQFVIAREYGFANWAGLLEEVRSTEQESVLQAVRKLHNGLLPALHTLFAEALGREVEVVIVEARQIAFGLYVQSLGPSFWSYRFHVRHHEGWANLAFSLPLCAAIVNPDAGGEEVRLASLESPPPNETIGEIPGRIGELWVEYATVIANLVKALAPEIEKAWETVFEMDMMDINLQTEPRSVQLNRATDPAIHIMFGVESEGYEDLTLSICYLLSTLEPVLPDLE